MAVDLARSRKRADPLYRSDRWRAFRKAIIARHDGRCTVCQRQVNANLHVDHIVSVKDAPERAFDPANVRVLCHSCHSRKTAKHDGGFGNARKAQSAGCSADGLPLGSEHPWGDEPS